MRDKILVTGGSGMVGKDLQHIMPDAIYISSSECDLTERLQVENIFKYYMPNTVIHMAAKVGGLADNINNPVQYLEDNILMNTNVIKTAYKFKVQNLIGILSTCVYPDYVDRYPITEIHLQQGAPAASNFSYSIAKRAMATQIDSYNRQYGTHYSYLIPANLYGPNDNFNSDRSHFIAALIIKILEAKLFGENFITIWGSGKPLRQCVYSMDLARIIKHCIENDIYENMNVAGNSEYSIMQIARTALNVCDAEEFEIQCDNTKPDGQFRKTADTTFFDQNIPEFNFTPLEVGIKAVYDKLMEKDNAKSLMSYLYK